MKERFEESWALWSILAAQATLTLPWMWRTAAYTDEALYLNAGHMGWSHLLSYATSFPGCPVLYPPIATALDSIGGLFAARLLSLTFMLVSTALIYLIGDRLFGRIPAVLGALLFAVCGIAVHLGAAATFDPMALVLLVLALYAAVRMRDGGVRWLLICPIALAAANLTKYATTAWDPVLIGTIVLYGWSKGRAQAICLAASVAATVTVLDFGILLLGGANLALGILVNTIYPSPQSGPPSSSVSVLAHAALMIGLIVLIAIAGVWASIVKKMPVTATVFLWLLVLAALLAPIQQARIHELTFLDENMSFGLPFAALGAGYALGAWRQWLGRQRHWGKIVATVAAVVTVLTMLIVGRVERVQFRGPGSVAAYTVALAIQRNYRRGTLVLVDGNFRTDQYNVPIVPKNSWVPADGNMQTVASICSGSVSILVLRMTGQNLDQIYGTQVAQLIHRMFVRKAVAGTAASSTQVWAINAGAGGCRAG
ncbi:MAG TPA: glycosyltransferase family 39 protein [Streptosporangiaceae bacterium]|nr:glycosyltransferase family 39 protein [Streptosporangiaceae bacterium]